MFSLRNSEKDSQTQSRTQEIKCNRCTVHVKNNSTLNIIPVKDNEHTSVNVDYLQFVYKQL